MTARISRDDYGLRVAAAVALRADCTRRQVGAVIVAPDGSIVATGYNGLASGLPGCASAGACPRGQMAYPSEPPVKVGEPDPVANDPETAARDCAAQDPGSPFGCNRPDDDHEWHVGSTGLGSPVLAVWPAVGTQAAGLDYEATGCRAAHAEVNAIIRAGRDRCIGATIYVTDEPCFGCSVVIEAAGIVRVVTPDFHWRTEDIPAHATAPSPSDAASAPAAPVSDVGPQTREWTPEGIAATRRDAATWGRASIIVPGPPHDPDADHAEEPEWLTRIRRAEARRAELAKTIPGWRP
jgi:deoxycytidylate deaminase